MALSMTIMDSMKDKASRLIPTPFADLVEESTSELLLVPDYERIMFLCDSANSKEDHAVDLVRAVRRRIDHKSAKIRYFTVVLLDAMIKNCGLPVHIEVAETKGLLVDLVAIAAKKPSADGEADAKKAALQLILNMSIWFSSHRSERVKPLATLVDAVRAQGATFDGLEPDLTVSLKVDASPPRPAANAGGGQGNAQSGGGATRVRRQARAQRHAEFAGGSEYPAGFFNDEPRVVMAIPLIVPTDEELSGMLDAAMLLVECLNAAEASGAPVHGDEIISNIGVQVRRDHRRLSQIISSGAELENMEMLLTVCDSQVAVIQRVAQAVRAQNAEHHMPAELQNVPQSASPSQVHVQVQPTPTYPPAPGYGSAPVTAVAPQQQQQQQNLYSSQPHPQPQRTSPALQPAPSPHLPAGSPAAGVRAAMDIDDVPRPGHAAVAPAPKPAAPAPTIDELFMDLGAPAPSPPPPAAAVAPQAPAPQVRAAFPAPSQSMNPAVAPTRDMTRTDEPPGAIGVGGAGSVNGDPSDDFDAFLNNRLAGK